jgi:hypothetical protein
MLQNIGNQMVACQGHAFANVFSRDNVGEDPAEDRKRSKNKINNNQGGTA